MARSDNNHVPSLGDRVKILGGVCAEETRHLIGKTGTIIKELNGWITVQCETQICKVHGKNNLKILRPSNHAKQQRHRAKKFHFTMSSYDLREDVSRRKEDTWKHRKGTDMYTGKIEAKTHHQQVDHVLEIQIFKCAFSSSVKEIKKAADRACVEGKIRNYANNVFNLNVTTREINQAKKGPIMSFINRWTADHDFRHLDLDDLAKRSSSLVMKEMWDDGRWARVKRAMVRTYEHIDTKLQTFEDMQPFQDYLHEIVIKMNLD